MGRFQTYGHTIIPDVKFVDHTIMVEISTKRTGSQVQTCVDQITNSSNLNKLGVNRSTTNLKEIVIYMCTLVNP